MKFFQGQRIRCRGEEWQIIKASSFELVNGHNVWEVTARGLTGIVRGSDFCFMSDIDSIEIIDPSKVVAVPDNSPQGRRTRLYWEANLRRLLPRNGALYLGQHGAVKPYSYQLKPAAQALHLMRPRIMIGDSVGLGKTIECGILLSELIRRGKANRILCAVPKAILEQFQNEMWGRFAIPFHRLDSKGLERLKQDLPSTMNPFFHHEKIIISIDTLKLKKYQKLLEECHWDVLVVDECHNVADRTDGGGGSARHRVTRRIADTANSVILMSATPHDGTRQGFASLIKLLDRTRIKDDTNYNRSDFHEHFIRRTRTQVASELEERGSRIQKTEVIPLADDEIDLLQSIHDGEKRTGLLKKPKKRGTQELFKTTLIKSLLSSPAALKATATTKLKSLEQRKKPEDKDHESLANFLRDLIHDIDALKSFSRFEHLATFIKQNPVSNDNRLVIFTERVPTLKALEEFLIKRKIVDGSFDPDETTQKKGILLATASGSTKDTDLQKIVKAFQTNRNGCQILIATNVASEGLNLHYNCHRLIHFDLPWSLITLEQRNGRIDRLGQKKQPEIYYFASQATKDTKETHAKDLKDDFWIVKKIERRIKTAAVDMDEEALSRFLDSENEELNNTLRYEEGSALLEVDDFNDPNDLSAILMGNAETSAAEESLQSVQLKKLASLFQKSPSDFVTGVCEEAEIEYEADERGNPEITMKGKLQFEISQWPREFRPENQILNLEANPTLMEKHYQERNNLNAKTDRSFMNEIHPFMSTLENTALGFFKGEELPTVCVKGEDVGALHFIVQSTLFNRCNDVVMQYWQILSQKKGSSKITALVNPSENDHVHAICQWLNSMLSKTKRTSKLDELTGKRIQKLAPQVIEEMKRLTDEARQKRGEELVPTLRNELKRIKDWEKRRQEYLESFTKNADMATHGGMHSQIRKAAEELETINSDSKTYNDFINDYLKTNDEADIRILGCVLVIE
jgi:ERCC4-related helicase